jgi:hypothetical protein
MKIAIAFFGQPRLLEMPTHVGTWESTFEKSKHDIDIYSHFWNTVSNTQVSDTYEEFVKEEKIKDDHFDWFHEVFKDRVKDIVVEDPSVMDESSNAYFGWNKHMKRRVDTDNPSTGRATLGQWYSTEKVLQQVKKSGITYDVVIRIRPDMKFEMYSSSHFPMFDQHIIGNFVNRGNGNRCVGVPGVEVKNGTPIVNDWWTVLNGNFIAEFSDGLTANIAAQLNAIFSSPDEVISVQENALHRHLSKEKIDTVTTYTDASIRRYDEDSQWKWPNYSV